MQPKAHYPELLFLWLLRPLTASLAPAAHLGPFLSLLLSPATEEDQERRKLKPDYYTTFYNLTKGRLLKIGFKNI